MAQSYKLFIDGEWVVAESGENFKRVNPANPKQILGEFQKANEEDIKKAVDAAEDAFEKWSSVPAPKRGQILLKIAEILKQKKEDLARLETTEMGKVLTEARGDVQEAIDIAEYMAGEGRRLFGFTTTSELKEKFAYTIRRPIGVCGLITPWNFPIAIPAWKLMPALICGNTVVFKPSSDTPLCAIEFVKILTEAGVPKGVVNLVTGSGDTAGLALVKNKKVRCISFTGNRETGEIIQKEAGIKRIGLELGGKNAIVILEDADLNLALDGVVWGGYGTTGQRCTACSRVIIHEKIAKKFERMLLERIKKLKLGNGLDTKTDIGPLVNERAVGKVKYYVDLGLKEGAKLCCGGRRPNMDGFFFMPTLFTEAEIDMRLAQEEIFGPVVSFISVKNFEEAVNAVNAVEYGLVSSIYTQDVNKAMKFVEKAETGIVYVNAPTIGAEVHLPFGGVKKSGTTREGGGLFSGGVEEFSELKTVYIDYSGKLQKAQIDTE